MKVFPLPAKPVTIVTSLYFYTKYEIQKGNEFNNKENVISSIMIKLNLLSKQHIIFLDGLLLINEKQIIQIYSLSSNKVVTLINRQNNKHLLIHLNRLSIQDLNNIKN